MPASTQPFSAGTVVDGFLVDELVHRGAMATLYRVHARGAEVPPFPLLMKVPELGTGNTSEGVLGFETERAVLPLLRGPHVPRFVAAGDIASTPHLVMEAIDGAPLTRMLEVGHLPAARVAVLGAALAEALDSVHQQGVLHLDLKPDNVLLRADGSAVLIDFGLAHHERLPDLLAEEQRSAAGSAPYLAPEQVLGVRSDRRSDLFALGVVLYELTTGELPFGIPATEAGLRDRIWLEPPPPRCLAPSTPPWLQEVILRCLEARPELRYQSAARIAFELRHPDSVVLTERATKETKAGFFEQLERWRRARRQPPVSKPPAGTPDRSPIILVAVDTTHPNDERQPFILRTTESVLASNPTARVIGVAVVGPPAVGETDLAFVEHRVRLMQWVGPLELPPHRVTLHVLEAGDPARALLEFARKNQVDLVILGAPGPDATLGWWRSVASTVTSQAHCSVYVVRAPERPG